VCRMLRSAARGELLVSQARFAIMQQRAFLVVGHQHGMISHLSCRPFWWPTLPKFYISLKSVFVRDWAGSVS